MELIRIGYGCYTWSCEGGATARRSTTTVCQMTDINIIFPETPERYMTASGGMQIPSRPDTFRSMNESDAGTDCCLLISG